MPEFVTVYHGTPKDSCPKILSGGLLRRFSQWKPRRIFVSKNCESAWWHGALAYAGIHREAVRDRCFSMECRATVVVFALRVRSEELHLDLCLDNRWQRGLSREKQKDFYLKRDVAVQEIVGYTVITDTLSTPA